MMENVFFFLIKVSICILGFYLVYFFIFRNITAFGLNRLFLITGLLSSFVIPAIDFSIVPIDYHLSATHFISGSSVPEVFIFSNTQPAISTSEDFAFLPIIYWTGFIIFCLRMLYGAVKIIQLKHCSVVAKIGSLPIVYADISQPFSFFNFIFLPKAGTDELVLQHEKVHVLHYHWIDLLLVEVAACVLWFNPLMILYKKSLKIQHEYEADAAVLSNDVKVENYLSCMLRHLTSANQRGLMSSFYSQNIKQRILMMTQNKATRKHKLLYLLFIPVLCGLMFAFSVSPIKKSKEILSTTPPDVDDILVIVDAGHGGTDSGGSVDQINEKDIALAVARDIQRVGETKGVKVILTRTGDEGISLEERISFARRHSARMFLSIHLDYDPENTSNSGIDVIVSEKNKEFEKSNGLAQQLKRELSSLKGIKVNGIKNSDFYVLSNSAIPAAMLQVGYLSNKADHAYITDEKNQREVSQSIIDAVLTSFK